MRQRWIMEHPLHLGLHDILHVLLDLQVIPLHHCLANLAHLRERSVPFLFPLQGTADAPYLTEEGSTFYPAVRAIDHLPAELNGGEDGNKERGS
ncbi:hypothetical protein [Pontibacter kalidii]|uniref:hypothetical protein n=1 Tax=Pontibacter kalidii TaxID=2592049 RepID=UPI002252C0D3|nr:hypothetical protein [Pontibacter kalidii]